MTGGLSPVAAIALVGVIGVGAQWAAWRFRLPAIVVMLAAGLLAGPVTGFFDPMRDIGPLTSPLITLAVAVILFEGGLTLDLRKLGDAAPGVRRLVIIGAPLGWLGSTLALHFVAGLTWASATVFGGIMIVTGPTVIAPLLRQARLARRPAQLLQWEAIVNDPIGALAAVLAFGVITVRATSLDAGEAAWDFAIGIGFALIAGIAAGFLIARAFWRGWVPEYMKVPVLFAMLLAVFAVSEAVLHESGLLAVTFMGIVIANADLPSFVELRRFKEHATILLVSGVFILLAASMDFESMAALPWHTALFIVVVILIVRPLTVLLSLIGTNVPRNERILIAATGPRGVVLVAVAGLFGERLAAAGVADGAIIGPLAFVLVLCTVVLHGFTLAPIARALGLAGAEVPGVLLVGGSRFTTGFAEALKKADVPVLVCDPNHSRLLRPRSAGVPTFYGDILSEAAEHQVEFLTFRTIVAATDSDAYNTLVATDLAPEFGRENTFQVGRLKAEKSRHALPTQLGGRRFAGGRTQADLEDLMQKGWTFRTTRLTEEYDMADWREKRPDALLMAKLEKKGDVKLIDKSDEDPDLPAGTRIISLLPPDAAAGENGQEAARTAED